MKKFIAMFLAMVMVMGVFGVVASADDVTEVALKVWAPQEDQANADSWLQQMEAKFEAAHPEYKITWTNEVCGEDKAKDEVSKDPAAAADVYMFANDQLGDLLACQGIARLGGAYLEQVQADNGAAMIDSVTGTDGNVYGFPMAANTWFCYYNKDVYTEEDVKSLETMLEKGVVAFPTMNSWYIGSFFFANGATVFGPAGNDAAAGVVFGEDNGMASLEAILAMVAHPNYRTDDAGLGNSGMKSGEVSAYFSGSWDYDGLKEALGDKLGACQLPTVTIGGEAKSLKSFAGIWLMPIHPSVTYHKYDVMDYYDIDPRYGTMADFDNFLAECEARDIRVILDLVLNHTGVDHPWFRAAAEYLTTLEDGQEPDPSVCPYVDYYFFDKEPVTSCYYDVEGTSWQYEGKFWSGMPDLNLGNEALREEIRDIMQFWLDKGVAGFRLDAAKEFYSGSTSKNCEVLSFLMDTARSIKSDAYLVAEVWESFTTIADYYTSGITSIFNFPFGDGSGKIVSVLRGAGNAKTVSSFATAQEKADTAYRGGNPDFIDAPFLSNHDTGRIAGFCSYDENKIKLAGAMNLFMSGNAFVYYGEELGMTGSGNDPSKRAPMLWNEARDDGTTDPPPECELPESYPFGSLEVQRQQEDSIWNYYRQAIAIRKDNPVIYRGTPTAETALNANCVSAVRKTWQDKSCIILMNIQEAESLVDLTDYADYTLTARLTVDENQVMMEGSVLTLPPYAVAVLTQNK